MGGDFSKWLEMNTSRWDPMPAAGTWPSASKGFDEKAHYFGRNLHDHLAAAGHNLSGEGAPLLERSVYYDGLTEESVAEIAALSEKLGMEALQAVNGRALELQRQDTKRGGSLRMNFGIYFFRAKKGSGADD